MSISIYYTDECIYCKNKKIKDELDQILPLHRSPTHNPFLYCFFPRRLVYFVLTYNKQDHSSLVSKII